MLKITQLDFTKANMFETILCATFEDGLANALRKLQFLLEMKNRWQTLWIVLKI